VGAREIEHLGILGALPGPEVLDRHRKQRRNGSGEQARLRMSESTLKARRVYKRLTKIKIPSASAFQLSAMILSSSLYFSIQILVRWWVVTVGTCLRV